MRIYISGPMRGISQSNFPAFDKAAWEVAAMGHIAVTPAALNRTIYPEVRYEVDERPQKFDAHIQLQIDLLVLKTCDAMVLLPGYEHSAGANLEIAFARAHNIPIYEDIEAIPLP